MVDFAVEEFKVRCSKAQELMGEYGMDALLLCSEAELRYFSGFRTLFWKSPTRCWYLVLPRVGDPIAIIPSIGKGLMRETWVSDIRIFRCPDPVEDELPLLREALSGYERIGLPMGAESTLHMPLSRFYDLRDSLSGEFCDGTPLVRSLRMVKSDAEVAIIREICGIGGRAFARAGDLFSIGMSLSDAFRSFRIALLEEGADSVEYLVGGCDPLGHGNIISPADDRKLAEGDILMLDTGATLRGYYCDFDRNFAFGYADDGIKRAYETLWHATEAGLRAAYVGNRACDVFGAMNGVIGGDAGQVGRFGHGLGMQLTEWPSLAPGDETVLQANMVLTLEPSISVGGGRILVMEENIFVGESGATYLTSRASPELPII